MYFKPENWWSLEDIGRENKQTKILILIEKLNKNVFVKFSIVYTLSFYKTFCF